jgi:outer membrane protein assembly factor BamB
MTSRLSAIVFLLSLTAVTNAGDHPGFGEPFSRNMVSPERNLPDSFDNHVKWAAALGSESYSTPVVAQGKVLIGTNNQNPRDPKHQGDRAVLMCFDEKTGNLVWQFVIPKMEDDPYLDWPKAGFASTSTVEGDRVYTLTNRGEVVCLDLNGMANGNDGSFKDEGKHMTPRGQPEMTPGPTDADILWICDLVKEGPIHTHDQVEGSVLIDGDLLYVNSANGVDNTHRVIRCPDAPSLVVLNKHTGKIVAQDAEQIAPNTFHCTWCPPSLGVVNGKRTVFFGGGDGNLYAFEALNGLPSSSDRTFLRRLWKYDPDPTAPKQNIHSYLGNRRESPSVIMGMPVVIENRIYLTAGGDLWWGKHKGWLKCVDAATGKEIWSYPLAKETCCTPAVYQGMVFATDCAGMIHCVDAETGKPIWTHKADGAFWASPMIADGKLYAGTRAGDFVVLAASREKKLISHTQLTGEPIAATVTPANGTLFIATMRHLYAIAK